MATTTIAHPVSARETLHPWGVRTLSYLYLQSVPYAAAAAGIQGLRIGPLESTGYLWLSYFLAALLLLLLELISNPRLRFSFPIVWMTPWLVLIWISLLWTDGASMRNLQDAMQMTLPFVIAILAAVVMRSDYDFKLLRQGTFISLGLISLQLIAWRLGLFAMVGLECQIRTLSMTLLVFTSLWLVSIPDQWRLPGYVWLLSVAMTFLVGSRTATFALLLLPVLHPRLKSHWMRAGMIGSFMLVGIGLFYTPAFQKRFFYTGRGTLGQLFRGDFLGFGRFDAWPKILSEADKNPLLGHGVGATREFVPKVWENITLPHNDYIRVYFETGFTGLTVFVLGYLGLLLSMLICLRRSDGFVAQTFGAAIMGTLMFLLMALTDNPITYALWMMNPLMLIMGAAYGMRTQVLLERETARQ